MSLLTNVWDAFNALAEKGVQRERMMLLADQLKIADQKVADLEKEKTELIEELKAVKGQLERALVPKDYVEHRGVLFRRRKDGTYAEDPFCPACRIVLFSFQGVHEFTCSKCGFVAPFTGGDLVGVLKALKAEL